MAVGRSVELKAELAGAFGAPLLVLLLSVGCADEEPTIGGWRSGSGASGGVSGASGASNPPLEAGAPAGGGTPTDGGAPGSGGSLAVGSDAGVGEGGANALPIDAACVGNRAFVAVSGAFIEPTPRELALGLNELIFDSTPMSFVLLEDAGLPRVAASHTILNDGLHAFPEALTPQFVPGWLAEGGFGSSAAQERGHLYVVLEDGPLEVPLANITFSATTQADCTRGVVSMNGVIPAHRADLVARLSGVPSDDSMDPDDRPVDEEVTVSALFAVDLVEFDFEALP
jgi:hypothetical protein